VSEESVDHLKPLDLGDVVSLVWEGVSDDFGGSGASGRCFGGSTSSSAALLRRNHDTAPSSWSLHTSVANRRPTLGFSHSVKRYPTDTLYAIGSGKSSESRRSVSGVQWERRYLDVQISLWCLRRLG